MKDEEEDNILPNEDENNDASFDYAQSMQTVAL